MYLLRYGLGGFVVSGRAQHRADTNRQRMEQHIEARHSTTAHGTTRHSTAAHDCARGTTDNGKKMAGRDI